uniref:NADH:ubiquinone reductase (H(+)-translocating) n=1 Tax=Spadella cephaloptera TaxID=52888 RepID=A0A141CKD4_9BILA|nr:NADH dehydrogenase subunit 5 [Spadella cephaloptera]
MVYMFMIISLSSIIWVSSLKMGVIYLNLMNIAEVILMFDIFSGSLSVCLVIISSSVMLWSYFYMNSDAQFRRFASLMILFIFSMLVLLFIPTMVYSIIGWDCLGVSSFLLVIYYSNRKSLSSGMLTGLTNRIGDAFFLLLIPFQLSSQSVTWAMIMMISLSMTKSAQFPFSSWLPAAMAAPTPVSALVHSSTLVTAGMFLLVRFNFNSSIMMILFGSFTMLMASLCACAESDLKKIIALSTLSQLGVMMIALGINFKLLCFFHLLCHALLKALLFLCVGSLIHSTFGSQEIRGFNNSHFKLWPSSLLIVGSMSLCGFPMMTGFMSKDKIIESFYGGAPFFFYILMLMGVGLSTAYSMKLIFVVLSSNKESEQVMISSLTPKMFVKLPLMVLGISSIIAGYMMSKKMLLLSSSFLNYADFIIPILFIISGIMIGIFISHISFPNFVQSMFFLTPIYQNSSMVMIGCDGVSKLLDNGIIEWVGPKGYNYNSGTLDIFWLLFTPFLFGPIIMLILMG